MRQPLAAPHPEIKASISAASRCYSSCRLSASLVTIAGFFSWIYNAELSGPETPSISDCPIDRPESPSLSESSITRSARTHVMATLGLSATGTACATAAN